MNRIIFAFIITAISITHLFSEIIKVPESFSSIQEGINAARNGDIVVIDEGTFTENIRLKENITVQGAGIDKTILRGEDFKPVVIGANYCKIEGMTITSTSQYPGYGIYCNNSSPTISNLKVTKTKWGIGCYFASPRILNNVIEGNYIEGIQCIASYPEIIENKIINNGDGIYCSFCFSLNIIRNEITGNKYTGIYSIHSSPTIKANVLVDNGYQNILCNKFSLPVLRENTISGKTVYNLELYNNNELIHAID